MLMTPTQSVEQLVKEAQAGHRAAFDELSSRLRSAVLERVRQRVGDRLRVHVEPEDILQETFLRAFESIELFRWNGDNSFLRWLNGIAENRILYHADRLKRSRVFRLDRDVRDSRTSPSRGIRRKERFEKLEKALERLSPKHREVILLARIEGLPVKEVAKRTGRTPNATAQLLWRALQKLRETFGDTESLHLPNRRLDEGRQDGD